MARHSSGIDTNSVIASLRRDLASVQKSAQSQRAAAAVISLDEPIEAFLHPRAH